MPSTPIIIAQGFSDTERTDVARIFWDGLGEKMGKILGPKSRGIAVMADAMDPEFILTARQAGSIIGMAGFKRPDGAFSQTRADILRRHFGRMGGAWRSALVRFDAPNSRPGVLVLDALCVARDVRSQGAGAALMRASVADGRARGLKRMTIQVAERNAAARRFYAREGCVEIGAQSLGPFG